MTHTLSKKMEQQVASKFQERLLQRLIQNQVKDELDNLSSELLTNFDLAINGSLSVIIYTNPHDVAPIVNMYIENSDFILEPADIHYNRFLFEISIGNEAFYYMISREELGGGFTCFDSRLFDSFNPLYYSSEEGLVTHFSKDIFEWFLTIEDDKEFGIDDYLEELQEISNIVRDEHKLKISNDKSTIAAKSKEVGIKEVVYNLDGSVTIHFLTGYVLDTTYESILDSFDIT